MIRVKKTRKREPPSEMQGTMMHPIHHGVQPELTPLGRKKKGPTKSMVMFHLDLTLPRMNSSPLKVGRLPQKERIVSQPSIFRGHLSFYIVSRSVAPHLLVGGHGFLHFETDTLHDHGIFLVEFQREISW